MAKFFDQLDTRLREFIEQQPVFFVATAAMDGRVNVSPKGLTSFRVLSDRRVAYLDVTGSGNETSAHIQLVNRITVMFCAFRGDALILRLFGTAQAVRPTDPGWPELAGHFEVLPGTRQIFDIRIDSIQTSCGYGVPFMDLVGQRETLPAWASKKRASGLAEFQSENNLLSIDGFPTGLDPEAQVAWNAARLGD